MNIFTIFAQGFKDGFKQPEDLTTGMTYHDLGPFNGTMYNNAYDSGVNLGQFVGGIAS